MTLFLTPKTSQRMRSLLQQDETLFELVDALGTPLNVVLPEQVADNVTAFREVYHRGRLTGGIFFAHKANRSTALLRHLVTTDAGIDVASLAELQHAVAQGFRPERIMATGPKGREFLTLAARLGVVVNADSVGELTELVGVVEAHRLPRVRVLARLSAFTASGSPTARRSRFGTPASEVDAVLDLVCAHPCSVELLGLAYHLDTIGLPEKAAALQGCLLALDRCHERGLRPRAVDIGGGFGVDYLAHAAEWEHWTTELQQAVLGRRAPLTWDGGGYGLRLEGATVRGALGVYPAHRPVSGPAYLATLLDTPSPSLRRPLGQVVLESMYDLHIEPGRALLDQCGLVLATVLEARDAGDEMVLRLDLNAGDVSLEEHGVLMDPLLIPRPPVAETDAESDPEEVGVYLLGNLCLEADLITRRKVFLPARPRAGDVLAFVNTAGYFMDFSANQAIMTPLARTVAMYRTHGAWRWCLDERYWPEAEVAA